MGRVRLQALALSCVMVFSIFLGGCGSKKKSGKEKDSTQKAIAMLDDFCAYYKIGKYTKLEKMIDGTSSGLSELKECQRTEGKTAIDAANQRLSYEVGDVKVDEDKAEAILTFKYFDVKAVSEEVNSYSTAKEVKKAIEEAKSKDLEFTCDLAFDEDWLIDSKSVDEMIDEMYSFLSGIRFEKKSTAQPTTAPGQSGQTLTDAGHGWYDDQFNEVMAYHQSDKFIRFVATFWEQCYGETVTFEFTDEAGNTYRDSVVVDDGDDFAYCDWSPGYKLPAGWLTCSVYDKNMNLVTSGYIEIYDDSRPLPEIIYAFDVVMVDKDGNAVPGYNEGTDYMAVKMTLDHVPQNQDLKYNLYDYNSWNSGSAPFSSGPIKADTTELLVPLKDPQSLSAGRYFLEIVDADQAMVANITFDIILPGEKFVPDAQDALCAYNGWSLNSMSFALVDKIPKDAKKLYFYFETQEYYNYMPFRYEVRDGSGKKIQEGTCVMLNSSMAEIEIEVPSTVNGSLKIQVYNPSGTYFCESVIEEET